MEGSSSVARLSASSAPGGRVRVALPARLSAHHRKRAPLARLVKSLLPAHDAPVRLTDAERRSLLLYCRDHPVATRCGEEFRFIQLAADLMAREEALCPLCRSRLVEQVRAHVAACHSVLQNLRIEAKRQRQQAQL